MDGTFSVPVDEAGAGYLEYDARIIVRKLGYDSAIQDIRIPGPHQRVLVTLGRGDDQYQPPKPGILDETLEMSKPYMP